MASSVVLPSSSIEQPETGRPCLSVTEPLTTVR